MRRFLRDYGRISKHWSAATSAGTSPLACAIPQASRQLRSWIRGKSPLADDGVLAAFPSGVPIAMQLDVGIFNIDVFHPRTPTVAFAPPLLSTAATCRLDGTTLHTVEIEGQPEKFFASWP